MKITISGLGLVVFAGLYFLGKEGKEAFARTRSFEYREEPQIRKPWTQK